MDAVEASTKRLNIVGCSRCHGDGHSGLVFEPLRYPVEIKDGPLTHWATCPETGEPILLRIENVE